MGCEHNKVVVMSDNPHIDHNALVSRLWLPISAERQKEDNLLWFKKIPNPRLSLAILAAGQVYTSQMLSRSLAEQQQPHPM